MPSARVFVDTNVWFSAFYGSPQSEKLVKAHLEGKIKAVISHQVLEELVRNIQEKIPPAIGPLRIFLQSAPPEIVNDPVQIQPAIKRHVDPKDQRIFAAAVQAKVQFFVTGNRKDFSVEALKKKFAILILTPTQAIKRLKL